MSRSPAFSKRALSPIRYIIIYKSSIKVNNSNKIVVIFYQVKYLGLVENLRVRRAGFAYRRPYEAFLNRYKSLCPDTWPQPKGDPKSAVQTLVNHLKVNNNPKKCYSRYV